MTRLGWLLPCWVWKWLFDTTATTNFYAQDGSFECVRIDDDFILVKYPTFRRKAELELEATIKKLRSDQELK
jgi:hypothetical protein